MKRQLLITLLIMCAASIAEAQQSARTAIEANVKQFLEASNKGDAAAVANMFTMDARLLPSTPRWWKAAPTYKSSGKA